MHCFARTTTLIAALSCCAAAPAGDLTPPGAPAPTMKTLDQVEPRIPLTQETAPGDADSMFRITQPGSYYLTDNLVVLKPNRGVEIAVGNVTLDLNGFTIAGTTGSLEGINADFGAGNVVVRNGVVQDMGASGIDLSGDLCVIEDVHAFRNGGDGMRATGFSTRIEDCAAKDNTGRGIQVGTNSVVRDCTASQNGGNGIALNASSVAIGCAAYQNGADGFFIGTQGQISDCSARLNGGDGFSTGFGAVIRNCTARDNTAAGISLGIGSTAIGCTAYSNSLDGVSASSDCSVIDTAVTLNSGAGIDAGDRATVDGCDASRNSGAGVDVQLASVVRDTRVSDNALEGVIARGQCLLDSLHVARNGIGNGRNGIDLSGGENVVRQCVVVGNGSTISVAASDVLDDNNFLANP